MSPFNFETHPASLIASGQIQLPEGSELEFCRYKPSEVIDLYDSWPWPDLKPFRVPLAKIGPEFLQQQFDSLKETPEHELGFISRIWIPGQTEAQQLFLLDFGTPEPMQRWQELLRGLTLPPPRLIFANSGRSFHGYGVQLITHEQWLAIMNQLGEATDGEEVIDIAWSIISITQGYSWLRWSWNDKSRFLQMPTLLS